MKGEVNAPPKNPITLPAELRILENISRVMQTPLIYPPSSQDDRAPCVLKGKLGKRSSASLDRIS